MPRMLKVAAAQLGAVHLDSARDTTLMRMIELLRSAASKRVQLLVFPELAFTTFFARHFITERHELDVFFEHGPDIAKSEATALLFEEAGKLGVDFYVGYAERTPEGIGYNTAAYYSAASNKVIGKYRKVHVPGTQEALPGDDVVNHLEKRYFAPGDLGFPAFRAPCLINCGESSDSSNCFTADGDQPILGMMICNDRRWPEVWRSYGLQGVELILCGYNTPGFNPHFWGTRKPMTPIEAEIESLRQHKLVLQANSYMNSCFSIAAARAGLDDGKYSLIGGSCIVDPEGHIVAMAKTLDDELVVAEIDLDECKQGQENIFNFALHRRPDAYGRIVSQAGAIPPPLL